MWHKNEPPTHAAGAVEHGYASSLPISLEFDSHMADSPSSSSGGLSSTAGANPGGLLSFRHRSNSSLSASSTGSSASSSVSVGGSLHVLTAPQHNGGAGGLKRLNSAPGAGGVGASGRKTHSSGNR